MTSGAQIKTSDPILDLEEKVMLKHFFFNLVHARLLCTRVLASRVGPFVEPVGDFNVL